MHDLKKNSFVGDATHQVSLPSFVDPSNMMHYHLNDAGVHKCKRIVCVIGHTHPDVTYAPLVFGICSIFLHYMTETQTYNAMCTLLQSKQMNVIQTKIAHETSKHVLKDLLKKHNVSLSVI